MGSARAGFQQPSHRINRHHHRAAEDDVDQRLIHEAEDEFPKPLTEIEYTTPEIDRCYAKGREQQPDQQAEDHKLDDFSDFHFWIDPKTIRQSLSRD